MLEKFWMTNAGGIIGVRLAENTKVNPATGEILIKVSFGTLGERLFTAEFVKSRLVDVDKLVDGPTLAEALA